MFYGEDEPFPVPAEELVQNGTAAKYAAQNVLAKYSAHAEAGIRPDTLVRMSLVQNEITREGIMVYERGSTTLDPEVFQSHVGAGMTDEELGRKYNAPLEAVPQLKEMVASHINQMAAAA